MRLSEDIPEMAFNKDIIASVAKELGISEGKVEGCMDFLPDWIRGLAKDPKNKCIYVPHVGTLYLNWSKIKHEYENALEIPEEEMTPNRIKKLERNKTILDGFDEEFKDIPDHYYNRHKKRSKMANMYFTKGKNVKELEEWQNKSNK